MSRSPIWNAVSDMMVSSSRTYQIALENLRSRMNSALGITEQGFSSDDACRVPWANQTTTTTATQS